MAALGVPHLNTIKAPGVWATQRYRGVSRGQSTKPKSQRKSGSSKGDLHTLGPAVVTMPEWAVCGRRPP